MFPLEALPLHGQSESMPAESDRLKPGGRMHRWIHDLCLTVKSPMR